VNRSYTTVVPPPARRRRRSWLAREAERLRQLPEDEREIKLPGVWQTRVEGKPSG
jgi:hypothetical protein